MVATGNWLIPQVGGDSTRTSRRFSSGWSGCSYWRPARCASHFFCPALLAGTGRGPARSTISAGGCGIARSGSPRRWLLLATCSSSGRRDKAQIDATLCFLDDARTLRSAAPSAARARVALVLHRLGGGRARRSSPRASASCRSCCSFRTRCARAAGWISRARQRSGRWQWALGPLAMAGSSLAVAGADADRGAAIRRSSRAIVMRSCSARRSIATQTPGITTKPFWYFLVERDSGAYGCRSVALTPWLWRNWRASWSGARSARVVLPLAWVALGLLFFSAEQRQARRLRPAGRCRRSYWRAARSSRRLRERRGPRNAVYRDRVRRMRSSLRCVAAAVRDVRRRDSATELIERLRHRRRRVRSSRSATSAARSCASLARPAPGRSRPMAACCSRAS